MLGAGDGDNDVAEGLLVEPTQLLVDTVGGESLDLCEGNEQFGVNVAESVEPDADLPLFVGFEGALAGRDGEEIGIGDFDLRGEDGTLKRRGLGDELCMTTSCRLYLSRKVTD